jgi:hypothetical protein
MIGSPWKPSGSSRETLDRQSACRRSPTTLRPMCEALDGRLLLTTVPAVALWALPAADVAKAASILNALAPTAFAQYQTDLARAEVHSHVSQAQVNKLAQAEAALDRAIESAGLDPQTTTSDLGQVQDVVDDAFKMTTDQANGWANKQRDLHQYLADVPGSTSLIRRTIAQMHVVARAARDTASFQDPISADEQVLSADLGPTPDTNLGPGAADRDPLVVYYNGQVDSFIR